jgi:hypothetical protein
MRRSAPPAAGLLLAALLVSPHGAQAAPPAPAAPAVGKPIFTAPAGFDVSRPLRALAGTARRAASEAPAELAPERGRPAPDRGHSADAAVQAQLPPKAIAGTTANFEGLGNQDNFTVLGGRVNPPDPVGDVGPSHYVEMVNLVFGVYTKTGRRVLGPLSIGDLWAGFEVDECTEPSGDPIVIHDQYADRWILTQFTTRGVNFPDEPLNPFYNCVAISTTGDPTGSYYRYAFGTGFNFPDYPKYGVWDDSYLITTREFGVADESVYGIGVYGLERDRMIAGDPAARAVSFLLQEGRVPLNLIGDGLLPADADGTTPPKRGSAAPIVGTQDDDSTSGATFDAVNVWEFDVRWDAVPAASIGLRTQLPTAEFDSIFPCAPDPRDCLPQPGITDRAQFLDILSYRQRPTWRLAHRTFSGYESMVTNQSVEARPGQAGVRWWELRRDRRGDYRIHQEGTFAPDDTVNRWMGSIAQDRRGNAALGYSVVNGTDIYPGIRYTGRRAGDRRGQMTLGEATVVNGTAAQTSLNSRWGDYTSMNVDPADDCTFWYVNEYYTQAGAPQAPTGNGWQTRIASFRLPRC